MSWRTFKFKVLKGKMALKFGHREWFVVIISILVLTDLAIILDILFLRQIIGFLFLTILPGLLILQILKLDKLEFTEKVVLSEGLSISFLMLFGLLLNNLSLALGYEAPLATIPLLISFNLAFVVLAIIGYKLNKDLIFSLPNLNLTISEKAFLGIPILFPALSIFGMNLMNTTDNNIILMFLLFLIPIYVAFVCFFNHEFSKRLYPIVIFFISISLLLLLSLRSNHIIGADIHREYYLFQTALNNLHWSLFGHSTLDACLSISLLPAIYQSILNISPEFLFKILYSLIYSVSPLIVFVLSKKYVGDSYAFLASCFFMFQGLFLFTEFNARTNTAILFFALAMMTLFNDKIDPLKTKTLFIVFMASCMVSHYSTTYIFFFIMLGSFIGMDIVLKKYTVKKVVSLTMVILFFALIFFWYSQVTKTAFCAGVGFIKDTLSNLNMFFVEESRGEMAQTLFGKEITQRGILHKIDFVFTWLTFTFIAIGVITLVRRYKEMSFSELKFKKPDFLKEKFEVTYFVIALTCAGLLVAVVAVPYVSEYNLDRTYTVAIIILSVFFVIGGIILSRSLKVPAYLIILLVLIPYFLFSNSVMYNIGGIQRSIILNSEGEQYDMLYVHDQESCSAKWLNDYRGQRYTIVANYVGIDYLISQGMLSKEIVRYDVFRQRSHVGDYIYFRYYNTVGGKLIIEGAVCNIIDYLDMFIWRSKIYDNGGSEVWGR